jgi:hypothetical protein
MIDHNGKTVIPFAPSSKGNVRDDSNPVDEAGKAIVVLLKEAADTARATCDWHLRDRSRSIWRVPKS